MAIPTPTPSMEEKGQDMGPLGREER